MQIKPIDKEIKDIKAGKYDKEIEQIVKLRGDSLRWTRAYFEDNIVNKARSKGINVQTVTGLSIQQEQAYKELDKLINAKVKKLQQTMNPDAGIVLTKQEEIYSKKKGISIMSGRGSGKDFFIAHVAHKLLNTLPDCHIVVTANTEIQLKNVFWAEFKDIAYLARKASNDPDEHETVITRMFDIQSEKASCKDPTHPKWFMEAIVSKKQAKQQGGQDVQHASTSGRHEKYLIFLVDEGSHIEDSVFKDFEDTMTGAVNFMIIIFNPKRSTGYAKRTQYEDKEQWIALRWNSEESEIVVNKQLHLDMENKYGGKNSNPYRISVLGLPPLTDTDTLFPADWIEDAKIRELAYNDNDPLIKGFDVGGGGDPSVIGSRRGGNVKDFGFSINKESDSNKVVQWARTNFLKDEADAMVGDVGGLGWHVIGALQKDLGWRMVAYDSRNKAIRDDLYINKRTEDIYGLRERFQNKTISIPDDEELTNELLAIKADNTKAKRAIIGKKELRKVLGGESTNKTDVLSQMFSVDDNDFRKIPDSYEDDDDDYECVGAPIRNKMTGY